ncbi:MAG: DUF4143 domain-containing protein [Patescibacteria group bacterium]|nr:DUF4143 domain-containing protein [Patescibacteria group bacterium]
MQLLINRTGNKLDITKISQELGVTRVTVSDYLEFLEGTYFISKIKPYSKSADVSLRGREKVYICDTGILMLLGGVSSGAIFENAIFNQIKTQGQVRYFQSKSDQEIDFVFKKRNFLKGMDELIALEVKTQAVRKDITRLNKLSNNLKIRKYFVVSQEYADLNKVIYPVNLFLSLLEGH